jgi:predicted DsbA family dithiol-disulfide isomerase
VGTVTVVDAETSELVSGETGTVTVWSDIGCPWASLALHTLRAAARERGVPLRIDHRAFPLELFNEAPTPKGILDAEIAQIAAVRPELGWKLWDAPAWQWPATLLPALEAVQAAKAEEVGGLAASDELDAALRHAFYAQARCISMPHVILDVAAECASVDRAALAAAIAAGSGRSQVYRDWRIAQGPDVQGSPHLFAAGGYARHNPGATYHWTGRPPTGFPRLETYDPDWAEELLDRL